MCVCVSVCQCVFVWMINALHCFTDSENRCYPTGRQEVLLCHKHTRTHARTHTHTCRHTQTHAHTLTHTHTYTDKVCSNDTQCHHYERNLVIINQTRRKKNMKQIQFVKVCKEDMSLEKLQMKMCEVIHCIINTEQKITTLILYCTYNVLHKKYCGGSGFTSWTGRQS